MHTLKDVAHDCGKYVSMWKPNVNGLLFNVFTVRYLHTRADHLLPMSIRNESEIASVIGSVDAEYTHTSSAASQVYIDELVANCEQIDSSDDNDESNEIRQLMSAVRL
jgi:hypothetical protein